MRLFFAYWPDSEKIQEILPWVRGAHALCGGRAMRPETLHMTLAFLGQADADAARRLADLCAGWALPSGSMVLNEPGRFPRARVVWLGPSATESASLTWLYDANRQLWEHLAPLGWQGRESVFRPHVSLLRNAGPAPLDGLSGPDVHWTPRRCVLVASEPTDAGSHYTVLAEVPLTRGSERSDLA